MLMSHPTLYTINAEGPGPGPGITTMTQPYPQGIYNLAA